MVDGQSFERSDLKAGLKAAARNDTAWLEEQIAGREWETLALEAFKHRLKERKRDAVALYFALRKMVNSSDDFGAFALRAYGMTLEAVALAARAYRAIEGMDETASIAYMLEQVRAHYAKQGKAVVIVEQA